MFSVVPDDINVVAAAVASFYGLCDFKKTLVSEGIADAVLPLPLISQKIIEYVNEVSTKLSQKAAG